MTNNMSGVCEGDEEQMNNSYERREHRAHRTGRLGSADRGGLLLFKLDERRETWSLSPHTFMHR